MDSKSIRSISLPSRSHPTTVRVEEVLNRIKSTASSSGGCSASAVCENLCILSELYQCMDEVLNMPSTIKALSQQRLGEEFLDSSIGILDICGIAREMASQFKENVRDLQSCLRRRKGDLSMESSLNSYTSFRKKMKKDAKRSISALKQIDNMGSNRGILMNLDDQHVAAVVRVLREINTHSVCAFQSVLVFLNAHTKPSKWSLVSKLVNKGKVGCENQQEAQNEVEIVDSAVHSLCKKDKSEKIQFVRKRLEILESSINVVESELEGLFRCLMRSRTSLLNIFSC